MSFSHQSNSKRSKQSPRAACVSCHGKIFGMGIQCTECPDGKLVLCSQCFTIGVEVGNHKTAHKCRYYDGSREQVANGTEGTAGHGSTSTATAANPQLNISPGLSTSGGANKS